MPWSTVLFDLDDTLFDSRASQAAAYDATMRSAGLDDPDAHRPTYDRLNHALWKQVEAGAIRPDDVRVRRFEQFCHEVGLDADPQAMADTFIDGIIRNGDLLAGASELLDLLSGRVRLGLVTNGIGEVQRGRLDRLGLGGAFDVVVISGEVGVAKPDPAIFDLAFHELDPAARVDTTVMIGDSLSSDIAGAIAARIDSIWLHGGRAPDVIDPVPTHRASTLADVARLVAPD